MTGPRPPVPLNLHYVAEGKAPHYRRLQPEGTPLPSPSQPKTKQRSSAAPREQIKLKTKLSTLAKRAAATSDSLKFTLQRLQESDAKADARNALAFLRTLEEAPLYIKPPSVPEGEPMPGSQVETESAPSTPMLESNKIDTPLQRLPGCAILLQHPTPGSTPLLEDNNSLMPLSSPKVTTTKPMDIEPDKDLQVVAPASPFSFKSGSPFASPRSPILQQNISPTSKQPKAKEPETPDIVMY